MVKFVPRKVNLRNFFKKTIQMNKRIFAIAAVVLLLSAVAAATTTTYTFKSLKWASAVGTITTDGKTDGWKSDKDASDYSSGYTDAQGRLYSCGVGVKRTTTGAGATSVIEFQNVRQVIVNFCQNSSKGKGSINVSVGSNTPVSYEVTRPETSGQGVYNRDVELTIPEQSGKVKLTVDCTENGIYINTITIKADNGSPNNPAVSTSVYRLVTDANQLADGDRIIFGVAQEGVNYMMGLYDEYNSRNNIFAESATYGTDRQTIRARAEYIYTVVKAEDGRFAFADALGWYLVASGGNPNSGNNNYLTVWDDVTSTSYGDYGLWNVTITSQGAATVESTGRSRSKYIQYNPAGANGHPIFACYSSLDYAPVAIYREQEEVSDGTPLISANFVNFGTQLLQDGVATGEKTIEVDGANLTDVISVALKHGGVFSVDEASISADGAPVTVRFSATEVGQYTDTLVFSSGSTVCEVQVLLSVDTYRTVAEARELPDLTSCYLNPVAVTKKYDRYIFVRDETGSMMLYDNGNVYGQGLTNGDVLTGVMGYMKDYYGNPELRLGGAFTTRHGDEQKPDRFVGLNFSESDICRYVRLENVKLEDIEIYDLFKYLSTSSFDYSLPYNVEGIVYYYDGYCICPTLIEQYTGPSVTMGDVNGDGSVDVTDVVGIANHVMGATPADFILEAADMNGDGGVDVTDVVALANAVMGT